MRRRVYETVPVSVRLSHTYTQIYIAHKITFILTIFGAILICVNLCVATMRPYVKLL